MFTDLIDKDYTLLDPDFQNMYSYFISLRQFGSIAAQELKDRYGKEGETPYWRFYFMRPAEDFSDIPDKAKRLRISGRIKGISQLCNFKSLEALSIIDRVDERTLSLIAELPSITHLELHNYKYDNFAALTGFSELMDLAIYNSSALTSLSGVEDLGKLQTLAIAGAKNLRTLTPLKMSRNLRGLELSAALVGVTYKPQVLETLCPIKELHNLKVFCLKAVRTEDDDLSAFTELKNLKRLEIPPREFSVNSMAMLAAAYSEYEEKWSKPLGFVGECRKCGKQKAMVIGYRSQDICSNCNPDKLEEFFNSFQSLVRAAREKYGL